MDLRIDPARAVLLIIDVQERLAGAMSDEDRAAIERNLGILIETARRLRFPVVASEQYPKGLGATVPAIAAPLAEPGLAVKRIEKVEFSCADAPAWEGVWKDLGRERDQWIVTGMETHVCVYQTARGLVARGAKVHVPADAVASRSRENRNIGMGLIERAGGVPTSTETVMFDLLGRAGGEDFKYLSKLVK
jgi:nicotinamidase-related amidase